MESSPITKYESGIDIRHILAQHGGIDEVASIVQELRTALVAERARADAEAKRAEGAERRARDAQERADTTWAECERRIAGVMADLECPVWDDDFTQAWLDIGDAVWPERCYTREAFLKKFLRGMVWVQEQAIEQATTANAARDVAEARAREAEVALFELRGKYDHDIRALARKAEELDRKCAEAAQKKVMDSGPAKQ